MTDYLPFASLMFAMLFLFWAAQHWGWRYCQHRKPRDAAFTILWLIFAVGVLAAVAVTPPAD